MGAGSEEENAKSDPGTGILPYVRYLRWRYYRSKYLDGHGLVTIGGEVAEPSACSRERIGLYVLVA